MKFKLLVVLAIAIGVWSGLELVNMVKPSSLPAPRNTMAYKTCVEIGGPNAWVVFKDNGDPVCVNKRGNKLAVQP